MSDLARHAKTLRDLHGGPGPLVLPNAWDVATAKLVAEAGFPVVATSSHAVADVFGHPDADSMPIEVAFGMVERIASSVGVPVTADLEAGYGLEPAEFVDRLLGAGAVGCNLEDSDHHGPAPLVDTARQAERIAAIVDASRAVGVEIALNARIDAFIRSGGEPAEAMDDAIDRARRYAEAGATSVYPIALFDEDLIARFVAAAGAPVNVMAWPGGPSVSRFAELGVRRVSYAAGVHRAAMKAVRDHLGAIASEAGIEA